MDYAGRKPIPFSSTEEMTLWLNDKRYRGSINERDEAFQEHCKARLILTPDHVCGANTDLRAALGGGEYRQFQDLGNTLSGMTDTYRSMEEVTADMRSPKYKSDAFERQRVAEKINRSSPDEAFERPFQDPMRTVVVMGDEVEGEQA